MDQHTNKNNYSKLFILTSIGVLLTMILATVFLSVGNSPVSGGKKPPVEPSVVPEPSQTMVLPYDKEFTAVVTSVNQGSDTFSLLDSTTEEIFSLTYSGGSDIRDKHGQILAASQIKVGDIVKVYYDSETKKIAGLSLSPDAWDYYGVTNLTIDPTIYKMTIGDAIYRYSDSLLVLNRGNIISLSQIEEGDQVTVRGVGNSILVLIVTRGHGYLTLEGSDDFIGGTIQVGNELITKVTDPMKIKVKEGEHLIIVTNKQLRGQKSVKIERFQTISLNLEEFGTIPIETGLVKFSVHPEGADLYVDGVKTLYDEPVELAFGDHDVEASLGGYITYQGKLNVNLTESTYKITLKEGSGRPTVSPAPGLTQPVLPSPTPLPGTAPTVPSRPGNSGNNDNTSEVTNTPAPTERPSNTKPTVPTVPAIPTVPPIQTPTAKPTAAPTLTPAPGKPTDDGRNITIKCTNGAEVLLNGKSMGKIDNGSLTFPKQAGTITFSLLLDGYITKHYKVTVEDDGSDAIFSFPAMVSG